MTGQPHYPYRSGDRAVLGPEVFASADGQTITWQGARYRRDHGPAGADAERLADLDAEPEPARWCCNGNAETCPLCSTADLPYPWICPGHRDTPANRARIRERAAASGGTDLRQRITAALRASWEAAANMHRDDAIRRDTDAVLAVIQPHLDHERREQLDAALAALGKSEIELADVRRRAEQAEAALARVRAVAHELESEEAYGGAWDSNQDAARRIHAALDQPAAHNAGPSIREAAAQDAAHWNDKYAGEER